MHPVADPDEAEVLTIDRRTLPKGPKYRETGHESRQVIDIYVSRFVIEYQCGLGPGDIELIVVDNGSAVAPQAGELTDSAWLLVVDSPIPTQTVLPERVVNIGIGEAIAELVGVLIDVARLASPGLCYLALLARSLSEGSAVVTSVFHLGPDVQIKTGPNGYCQEQEDRLLASVDWQQDGYRLFVISFLRVPVRRAGFVRWRKAMRCLCRERCGTKLVVTTRRLSAPAVGW